MPSDLWQLNPSDGLLQYFTQRQLIFYLHITILTLLNVNMILSKMFLNKMIQGHLMCFRPFLRWMCFVIHVKKPTLFWNSSIKAQRRSNAPWAFVSIKYRKERCVPLTWLSPTYKGSVHFNSIVWWGVQEKRMGIFDRGFEIKVHSINIGNSSEL